MAVENKCLRCAHAVWDRTAAGRLHPNGRGRCSWTKAVAVPASWDEYDIAALRRDLQRPRWIDRSSPNRLCDTFLPGTPK